MKTFRYCISWVFGFANLALYAASNFVSPERATGEASQSDALKRLHQEGVDAITPERV